MTTHVECKASFTVDETGVVEGIAWPFGTPDRVGDLIEKGAFAKALPPLPMLAFHDQRDAVGVWEEITEAEDGLRVKGRLLIEDVPRARELRALIREKAVGGLSIGFTTTKAAPRQGGGRVIADLNLLEISLVAVPAHPGARITAAKAFEANEDTMSDNTNTPDLAPIEAKMGALAERLDAMEAKANRPAGKTEEKAASAETKAFGYYLRQGPNAPADELKALTVNNDPSGGYMAPPEMASEFIRDLVEFSPMRSVASIRATAAPSVVYPTRTSITNAKWKGETQDREASEPAFGQTEIPVREINTFVEVSNQLLADSGGDAEREVRLALAEDFGQKEAAAFVNGSGVLDPEGLMTHAAIPYTPNGHATNLSPDALINLLYALPATYRNAGAWGMNASTLATIRKLKDGDGRFLWQPSYAAGQPETILGRPVVEMIDMPDPASGAFPIIYGDFSGYRIVDRVSLSVLVDPYSRATNGITRFHATRRVGGRVIQAAKFRKLRMATN